MDYWDDVMQDDVHLIVTEGWWKAARPRVLVGGAGKAGESPDLMVKRSKYKMDLLPQELVADRSFAGERSDIDRLLAEVEAKGRKMDAFVEENAGEDGPLSEATAVTGKVTKTAVTVRLRAVGDGAQDREEFDALKACLDLMKAHGKAKRASKAVLAELDKKVLDRYALLDGAEVADMVVRDKWMASIEDLAMQQVKRLTDGPVGRLEVLEDRHVEALPDLVRQVEDHVAKVDGHRRRMALSR